MASRPAPQAPSGRRGAEAALAASFRSSNQTGPPRPRAPVRRSARQRDTRTDLDKADLTGAFLNGASLTKASLGGADLTRAVLDEADLTGAFLGEARWARDTVWPPNLRDTIKTASKYDGRGYFYIQERYQVPASPTTGPALPTA